LIRYGKNLLESTLGKEVTAFRAGSYAANAETFQALARNGITIDSSINECCSISAPELVRARGSASPFLAHGVTTFPVSVFRDGFSRMRPAQVGACSFQEMRQALTSAQQSGWTDFVIVSHNFEMLKPGVAEPDLIVVRRFESLCRFLEERREDLPAKGFSNLAPDQLLPANGNYPRATLGATTWRHLQQITRRVL
jgi:hypothetical protein